MHVKGSGCKNGNLLIVANYNSITYLILVPTLIIQRCVIVNNGNCVDDQVYMFTFYSSLLFFSFFISTIRSLSTCALYVNMILLLYHSVNFQLCNVKKFILLFLCRKIWFGYTFQSFTDISFYFEIYTLYI